MGVLVNGKWDKNPLPKTNKKGEFIRPDSGFRNSINSKDKIYQAQKNRYHLYISYACPWAHRTLISLKIKKLDKIISFSSVNTLLLDNGWEFNKDKKNLYSDPILNKKFLRDLYILSDKNFSGKVTVPVLWDKKTKTIVNNESSEIMRILNSEFNNFTKVKTDFYPIKHKVAIDKINDFVYENINNGVYKVGFATSQDAYDKACENLFKALDKIEKILEDDDENKKSEKYIMNALYMEQSDGAKKLMQR